MKVTDFDTHVRTSDQYAQYADDKRREIAILGVVSEIGSLISALKKERLGEHGKGGGRRAKAAVSEEIGDIIWYCFSLSQIENQGKPVDILAQDIRELRKELTAKGGSADLFRAALSKSNLDSFLEGASQFPRLKQRTFGDYQQLAFKTARTKEDTLLGVCLSVLLQLGAELVRNLLPESEKEINTTLPDRPVNRILGEIAWHLSAVATLYDLPLDEVIVENVTKTAFRTNRSNTTPLHDDDMPNHEQLPRRFEIKIVTVAEGRSRMYYQDKKIGDDLTDNAYDEDGYRFHDVMHLANAAKLGWSPVLRSMMGRKRKSVPKTDEVEDGARAQIVEEAVLKTIHSEARKMATLSGNNMSSAPLFVDRDQISFSFLKFVRGLVAGLEVEANTFWEWEDAIFDGYRAYNLLRQYGQGTITVDLQKRTIEFSEHVSLNLNGVVGGLGSHVLETSQGESLDGNPLGTLLSKSEVRATGRDKIAKMRLVTAKAAILQSLGISVTDSDRFRELELTELEGGILSVRTSGVVQETAWQRGITIFRTSFSNTQSSLSCCVLAIADPASNKGSA